MSMQQRGERHVERLASVSERAVDHIETMNGPEILNSVDQIEKLDKVARRTCGRSPRVASPARQEPFRPPDETGSCPKISLRTICSGSSAGWSVSPRQSQRAFESTGISRIILGFPSDRLALRQVVALPASSQGVPGRNCGTKSECTPDKLFGHVRCLQASEDTECVTSSK